MTISPILTGPTQARWSMCMLATETQVSTIYIAAVKATNMAIKISPRVERGRGSLVGCCALAPVSGISGGCGSWLMVFTIGDLASLCLRFLFFRFRCLPRLMVLVYCWAYEKAKM